jgi:hypothetical protein
VNLIGLFLSLIGALLLFRYVMPSASGRGEINLIFERTTKKQWHWSAVMEL